MAGRILYSLGYMVRETGQALDRLGMRLQGNEAFKEQLSRHRTVMNLFDKSPVLPASAFVAPSASVIGDVSIGEKSSVWYNSVLRGDVNKITVGSMTNIQDGCVVHVAKTNMSGVVAPTIIGSKVTVGHNTVLHACTVADESFVGMGATLLDGVVVEKGAMVAAGAMVPPGVTIPSGEIWAGNPAKFLRNLTPEESKFIASSAVNYAELAAKHAEENNKTFLELEQFKVARKDALRRSPDFDAFLGVERSNPAIARS
mmetsp:Transcript_13330/g.42292  ORF Transcript_13330/g.42292 Transcript_13330/m.42292 type:complete len:257 (-) Transcript_13330:110-880(-)|eukprot:CAMPEP_0182897156 /NCGR_PEP_ID=MMETSP0034_2-20130328/26716_1 /TAXON_ID=156128 /ORGANISM="Nephroselmis pyriformis, Strain CCMP717" /LENGTH=256 /DNA_ID=CAMNT_0025031057 /DNA_START=46 /DNA_END=816 /DNA_ORIENTATION=+